MSLIRLVYASAATKPFMAAELGELLVKARAKNSSLGITGLLLYHQRSFFQILEGSEGDVTHLFEVIGRDPRHERVLLLSKTAEAERSFGEWSMGFVAVEKASMRLPGFLKLLDARASFLDLKGDSKRVAQLIDGFQDGRWRQGVEA